MNIPIKITALLLILCGVGCKTSRLLKEQNTQKQIQEIDTVKVVSDTISLSGIIIPIKEEKQYTAPDWYEKNGQFYKHSSGQSPIQTKTFLDWGGALNKILGMVAPDDYDAIKEVRAKLKNVKLNIKTVNQLKELRKNYEKGDITSFEYNYSRAALLGVSMSDLDALEVKAYQIASKIYR